MKGFKYQRVYDIEIDPTLVEKWSVNSELNPRDVSATAFMIFDPYGLYSRNFGAEFIAKASPAVISQISEYLNNHPEANLLSHIPAAPAIRELFNKQHRVDFLSKSFYLHSYLDSKFFGQFAKVMPSRTFNRPELRIESNSRSLPRGVWGVGGPSGVGKSAYINYLLSDANIDQDNVLYVIHKEPIGDFRYAKNIIFDETLTLEEKINRALDTNFEFIVLESLSDLLTTAAEGRTVQSKGITYGAARDFLMDLGVIYRTLGKTIICSFNIEAQAVDVVNGLLQGVTQASFVIRDIDTRSVECQIRDTGNGVDERQLYRSTFRQSHRKQGLDWSRGLINSTSKDGVDNNDSPFRSSSVVDYTGNDAHVFGVENIKLN